MAFEVGDLVYIVSFRIAGHVTKVGKKRSRYDYAIRPLGRDGTIVEVKGLVCRAIVSFVGPVPVDDRLRGKP